MPKDTDNWNSKNLTTFSTWIQVASFKIECLDSAIHKNRSIIQQSVIYGLILATVSGSISITQFGNFSETVKFIFNLMYTFLTFNIAFITGYVKTFQIQEKLEEYLQLKQNWISFSASITAELQLPKELRRDAEQIISENKEKYLDLFKNDLEVSTYDVKRAIQKLDISKNSNNYLPITVKNSRSLSISNIMLNTVLTQLINEINENCEKNNITKEEQLLQQQRDLMEIVKNEKCFAEILLTHEKIKNEQKINEEKINTAKNDVESNQKEKEIEKEETKEHENIEIKIHDIHKEDEHKENVYKSNTKANKNKESKEAKGQIGINSNDIQDICL